MRTMKSPLLQQYRDVEAEVGDRVRVGEEMKTRLSRARKAARVGHQRGDGEADLRVLALAERAEASEGGGKAQEMKDQRP